MSQIGFRVFKRVDRVEKRYLELFREISVSNVADCMGRIFSASSGIRPFGKGKLLGSAITVKVPMGDNLMLHQAIDMVMEGDIIVVDGNGFTERAICGENMMRMACRKGCRGFLIDGAFRDSAALEILEDFTIFARSVRPDASYKALGPGEINVPVSVGGMVVYPGDLILGDEDGVIAISPQHVERVYQAAKQLHEKEAETVEKIENGTMDHSWVMKALLEKGCEFIDTTWKSELK